MATFGKVGEFNGEAETMSAYLERVQLYLTANAVSGDKKVTMLLSVVGSSTYALLRSLTHPALPATKTWDQLTGLLMEHHEPKPLVIAERFRFHRRNQTEGESLSEYSA